MNVIEKIRQITGLSEEQSLNTCPDSMEELAGMFNLMCTEGGDHCEECLHQELKLNWTYEHPSREIWNSGEWYATKEEAIEAGKEFAKTEGITAFEVGEKLEIGMPGIDTDSILEHIAESVYDEVGEAAETYLEDVKREHQDELEEKLNEALFDWATKYGYHPSCWKVVNVETIKL